MKKSYLFLCFSVLILMLPSCIAGFESYQNYDDINQQAFNDTPDWATGSFIGIVGVTNYGGKPGPYGGFIAGYYEKQDFKGKFIGAIAKKDPTTISGFIGGYIGGPFLVGIVTNSTTEKIIPIVGIGISNETHLYYRIMGLFGPTLYIAGKYQHLY